MTPSLIGRCSRVSTTAVRFISRLEAPRSECSRCTAGVRRCATEVKENLVHERLRRTRGAIDHLQGEARPADEGDPTEVAEASRDAVPRRVNRRHPFVSPPRKTSIGKSEGESDAVADQLLAQDDPDDGVASQPDLVEPEYGETVHGRADHHDSYGRWVARLQRTASLGADSCRHNGDCEEDRDEAHAASNSNWAPATEFHSRLQCGPDRSRRPRRSTLINPLLGLIQRATWS